MSGTTTTSYKTPRKQQDPEWAFDFRTNLSCYNDSDDSDLDSNPPVGTDSTDAKLLKDMDLSTREEAVTYKPNPFSIAKINAAYRASAPKRNYSNLHPPPSSKPATNSNQTSILEGFKTQELKALDNKSVQQSPKMKASDTKALRGTQCHHQHSPSVIHGTQTPLTLPLNSATNYLPNSCLPTERLNSRPAISVPSPPIGMPNASTANVSDLSENAHISTENVSYPASVLTCIDGQLSDDVESWNASRLSEHDSGRGRSPILAFSSPLRTANPDPYTNLQTNPFIHQFSSPIRPPRSRFQGKNLSIPHRLTGQRTTAGLSTSGVFSRAHHVETPTRPEPGVPVVRQIERSIKREDAFEDFTPLNAGEALGNKIEITDERFNQQHPPATKAQLGHSLRPRVSSSPSPPKASTSKLQPAHLSSPVNTLRRYPVRPQPIQDAYNFSATDLDEEWSTLPSRKRKKPKFSSSISITTSTAPKFTPSFSIPALLAVPNASRKETSTTTGRRVHTYLPPPPPGQSHSMSAMKTDRSRNAGSSALLHIKDDPEMNSSSTNFDSNVYPSPSRSCLSRPAQAKTRSAPNDAVNTLQYENRVNPIYYRPLSPPTSDLAMPVDDPDVLVNVDLRKVRKNYPAARVVMHKVSLSIALFGAKITYSPSVYYPSSADVFMLVSGILWDLKAAALFAGTLTTLIRTKGKKFK
ncbi:hypothetical protein BDZ97DRAFT_1914811 [Flammula alnicola]|nr:hypothetical protein BDZ97DRAFT_1914811 [Flammula alnicola]